MENIHVKAALLMQKLDKTAICRRCCQLVAAGAFVEAAYSWDECLCPECGKKVKEIEEAFQQPIVLPPVVADAQGEIMAEINPSKLPLGWCKRCGKVAERYKSSGGCKVCARRDTKKFQAKKRAERKEYIAAEVIKPAAGEKKKGAIIVKQLAKKNANDPALPRKACIRCKTVKSLDQFYLYTNSPDGHDRYCAACGREMKAESDKRLKEKKENRWQTKVDVVFIPRQPVMEDYLL